MARDTSPRCKQCRREGMKLFLKGERCLTDKCGIGVTSEIVPTSSPVAVSERMAVSRPEPGPLTKTSIFFMPWSMARRPAASAAICAANGVDLREPLKPAPPADSHAITLPSRSVSATIVLLKLVLMCAWPNGMFFLGLRRPRPLPPLC